MTIKDINDKLNELRLRWPSASKVEKDWILARAKVYKSLKKDIEEREIKTAI